ncbi:hypothetical protein pb186bvf_017107 [Paramecium bursaria]
MVISITNGTNMQKETNNFSTHNFQKIVLKEDYSLSIINSNDNPQKIRDIIANVSVNFNIQHSLQQLSSLTLSQVIAQTSPKNFPFPVQVYSSQKRGSKLIGFLPQQQQSIISKFPQFCLVNLLKFSDQHQRNNFINWLVFQQLCCPFLNLKIINQQSFLPKTICTQCSLIYVEIKEFQRQLRQGKVSNLVVKQILIQDYKNQSSMNTTESFNLQLILSYCIFKKAKIYQKKMIHQASELSG